jgi:hypothetical protein
MICDIPLLPGLRWMRSQRAPLPPYSLTPRPHLSSDTLILASYLKEAIEAVSTFGKSQDEAVPVPPVPEAVQRTFIAGPTVTATGIGSNPKGHPAVEIID